MRRLNWTLLLTLALTQAPNLVAAQSLQFCEQVGKDGRPSGSARNFQIEKKGSAVVFYVQAHGIFNCSRVTIDLYKLSTEGAEQFDRSIEVDVQPYDHSLQRRVVFYAEAAYAVYSYDEYGKLLGAGRLNLLFRK